jgi:Tfp pilus assembly ATPase PilU
MQTNTARGMQTMEQALADLTVRRVVKLEDALTRSSRPEQLLGILERQGFDVNGAMAALQAQAAQQPVGAGLRVAGA